MGCTSLFYPQYLLLVLNYKGQFSKLNMNSYIVSFYRFWDLWNMDALGEAQKMIQTMTHLENNVVKCQFPIVTWKMIS